MTRLDEVGARFNAGALDEAIALATAEVKARPTDPAPRLLLAELLLFTGAFARVEALLTSLAAMTPDLALVTAEFRQLLRATMLRQQVLSEGAVPSFLGEPTEAQRLALLSLVSLRAGDDIAAAEAAAQLETVRPRVAGIAHTAGGTERFDDLRDADDVFAGSLELLTTTGSYYWVPTERIETLLFHDGRRPRDLFWRRCTVSVQDGPEGDVYMPICYPGVDGAADQVRLGRETVWSGTAPVRGQGQRLFLAGEEGLPILELEELEIAGPAA